MHLVDSDGELTAGSRPPTAAPVALFWPGQATRPPSLIGG